MLTHIDKPQTSCLPLSTLSLWSAFQACWPKPLPCWMILLDMLLTEVSWNTICHCCRSHWAVDLNKFLPPQSSVASPPSSYLICVCHSSTKCAASCLPRFNIGTTCYTVVSDRRDNQVGKSRAFDTSHCYACSWLEIPFPAESQFQDFFQSCWVVPAATAMDRSQSRWPVWALLYTQCATQLGGRPGVDGTGCPVWSPCGPVQGFCILWGYWVACFISARRWKLVC